MNSIHQLRAASIDGGVIDFSAFAGKKVLIVNVASECGYTPQYAQLQELQEHFKDRLTVVGFPCNDFGGQEPGSEQNIRQFCQQRYGVTFPLAAKVHILGKDPHPVYNFLTKKDLNGKQDSTVTWNFQKYLLDENGELLAVFPPAREVFDASFLSFFE